MKYVEIRQAFIDFFESKQHQFVESSSLIPHNDPSIMFTNAGMNQFKDVFLGTDKRKYNRAVTIQKCLRAGGKHNDLENVGFTARHHTFFEMMGNFSFGDYFKKEAIEFAWEFLTKTLSIPEDRLYVTVFETDDEAAEIWQKHIGVPKEKIYRFGEKDNFWRMGQTGPCGPCSEIFYDHNPNGPKVSIDQDEDRFVEIWNLVFMQFFEDENGKQTPLPKPSVDTGSGIERVAAALQGVTDNYQTDVFQPLVYKTCELAGLPKDWLKLAQNPNQLGAVKVVADHARTAAFLISEGVLPSNEGPGYVLRRIVRRAIRYARNLSIQTSIFPEVVAEVINTMTFHYPVLGEKKEFILQAVRDEETRFLQTLDKGSEILKEEILKLQKKQKTELSGQTAFTLYDTYGFPFDLTELMAKEEGLKVDEKGFNAAMEAAKDKARKAHKTHSISSDEKHLGEWTQNLPATQFVGDSPTSNHQPIQLLSDSKITGLSDGEKAVDSLKGNGWVSFDTTPFYAEGGGQVADRGAIYNTNTNEQVARVVDVRKMNDKFIHYIEAETNFAVGETYRIVVASHERQATMNNHSATHLLQAALKQVLGDHVSQAGSLVNSQKLRFDFTHNSSLTTEEWEKIERVVNDQIATGKNVDIEIMPIDQAKEKGAVAMFGEKYGDEVRVLTMGETIDGRPFSMELCGGTHVQNLAQIRLFKIVDHSNVAAGVRRIEAVTGVNAFKFLDQLSEENKCIRQTLLGLAIPKGPLAEEFMFDEAYESVKKLKDEVSELKKLLKEKASQSISIDDILKEAQEKTLGGQKGLVLMTRLDVTDRNLLSEVADKIRDKNSNIAMVLIGESENGQPKPLIVAVSKNLKKLHAGKITKELCTILEGKGGGRPDFAQGSVSNLDKLKTAKDKFYELLEQ